MDITDIIPADRWSKIEPSVQRRIRIEADVIDKIVTRLIATGRWVPASVDYGDDPVPVKTSEDVLREVFSVDQAHVYFHSTDGVHQRWFFAVLGNDGWDVINDYSGYDDDFSAIIEKVTDEAEAAAL